MTVHVPKKRLVVVADSHRLSDFQRCPERYLYTGIKRIKPIQEPDWMARGSCIAKMLEEYYRAKQLGTLSGPTVQSIIDNVLMPWEKVPDEMKERIALRFMQYYKHYRAETWNVLAVEPETDFSKVLYEDDYTYFVYEGTPDMVIRNGAIKRAPCDHKHQTVRSKFYPFRNQFLGYCWAVESEYFCVNIFGMQESGKAEDWFTRPTFSFTKSQIEQWKNETIHWFYKLGMARRTKQFGKSYACESKFGTCEYSSLCEQTLSFVIADKIKREYKKNDEDLGQ